MIAVVSPSSTSTSGRASVGMKPCTKALYVSLISRCDSAAIVSNTSELLPEPETPVNTVSLRFGISMLMSLRLFTRAPCTRIRSWLSATCSAAGCVSVLAVMLIVSPSVRQGRLRGLRWRRPARSGRDRPHSLVLNQPQDIAIGVGEGGHQAAATDVARGLLQGAARGYHLGQLRLDVRHLPDVLARDIEADVVGRVVLRRYAEQGGVHRLGLRQVGHGMQHGLDSLGGRPGHDH